MLCNYLFFKGCELGVKTKSFGDYPVLAGAATVSMWLVFNIGSVLLLITHHLIFRFRSIAMLELLLYLVVALSIIQSMVVVKNSSKNTIVKEIEV